MLETFGVPIFGYRTTTFPEFYCIGRRHPLEMHFNTPEEVAKALRIHWSLGLNSGVVIAQPVREEKALPNDEVERWISEAFK